eukprot:m.29192 g.29192  ORF g.29192 m.29192 type:complete len:149 (+) comp31147_c0_seq1:120-566(+)
MMAMAIVVALDEVEGVLNPTLLPLHDKERKWKFHKILHGVKRDRWKFECVDEEGRMEPLKKAAGTIEGVRLRGGSLYRCLFFDQETGVLLITLLPEEITREPEELEVKEGECYSLTINNHKVVPYRKAMKGRDYKAGMTFQVTLKAWK